MKLFIASCIVCIGLAVCDFVSTPVFWDTFVDDSSTTPYNPEGTSDADIESYTISPSYDPVTHAIYIEKYNQEVQDFLTEKNILKLLQILASSHQNALEILENVQNVSNEGYGCVSRHLECYDSEIKNGTLSYVDSIFVLAQNECLQHQTELTRLGLALKNADVIEIVDGLKLSQYVPARFAEYFEEYLIAVAQLYQSGFLESRIVHICWIKANFATYLLRYVDKATATAWAKDMPFLADLVVPGSTYYVAYKMYLRQSLLKLANHDTFTRTELIYARIDLQQYEKKALSGVLSWLQDKINNAEILPHVAGADSLSQLAYRIKHKL